MAIPSFYDIAPFPKGTFVNGHFVGTRLVECPSADIAANLAWLDTFPNNNWPYPFGGWSQTAPLTRAEVQPKPGSKVSGTPPTIDYDKAWIELVYDSREMLYVGGYYVHEEWLPGTQRLSSPRNRLLEWASDGEQILPGDVDLQIHAGYGVYRISLYRLLAAPASANMLVGKVNATRFQMATLGGSFAPGAMLCEGARIERGSPGSATSDWKQAHFEFRIRPEGWDSWWRSDMGRFEQIRIPGGSLLETQRPEIFSWTSLRT